MSAVQEFFRINPHVSETLHTKTLNYTAAMWTLHRGIDHQAVLAELPLAVKQEVMTSLHKYRVVAQEQEDAWVSLLTCLRFGTAGT